MTTNWIADLWQWYAALAPDMLFLFTLPFCVAAFGLLLLRSDPAAQPARLRQHGRISPVIGE